MAFRRVPQQDDRDVAFDEESSGARELKSTSGLFVKQQIEYLEAMTGFETENQYEVFTRAQGGPHLRCAEKSGTLSRMFLGNKRPFELFITAADGSPFIKVERPWRFLFQEIKVSIHTGGRWVATGGIKQKFSVCTREFEVEDYQGRLLFAIQGPMFNPWTFNISNQDGQLGCISKKFSGFAKVHPF
jgi:hypothetical protein